MLMFLPTTVNAQSLYGQRLASKDGKWLLPVATLHLGSTEADHIRRGSVQAWDLIAPLGSPVFPIADGVIEYAGCDNRGGYGCWIFTKHSGGIRTIMGHCVQGSILVKAGQTVTQWTPVCQVGWTGMTSFGPHTHLEIHKPGGGRYNISDFWDITKMHYQKLGNATTKEVAKQVGVVGGQSPVTVQQQAAPTRWAQLLRILAQYPPQTVSLSIMVVLGLLVLLYWLGGRIERIIIIAGSSGMAGALVVVWLFMPLSQPVQAQQQADGGPVGSAAWEWAYPIIQSNEGWKCTNDGAYTMGGVTQGTYNRWRAKKGMGFADVCANLTRAQAKAIYYELFWVPTGANTMPARLALTVVDHYINTGAVKHLLAQCGTDVACFNRARIADYRTKGNCALYCVAWINRVNKIRKYSGG